MASSGFNASENQPQFPCLNQTQNDNRLSGVIRKSFGEAFNWTADDKESIKAQ